MKNKTSPSGIMLYAKDSGPTSFGSLWSIKKALGTEKVGHTGTLDSFADGLLVVLTGSLTHLVPHITGFSKTYEAVICFGKSTDTLDPTGKIVKTGPVPEKEQVEKVLESFKGPLLQVPPVYSALHVDGKRASELVREGAEVKLESRQIVIYDIKLVEYKAPYAHIKVSCSKGTYIRALARDIASKLETQAYLTALRRTRVGPFKLEDAACSSLLKPFTIDNAVINEKKFVHNSFEKKFKKDSLETVYDIRSHFLSFTPELAFSLGFYADFLKSEYKKSYLNGRPLSGKMFARITPPQDFDSSYCRDNSIAVFYEDRSFAGMIKINDDKKLVYSFVVPYLEGEKTKVFTWEEITGGAFPLEWKKRGTAVSVGSFDGLHAGHMSIISAVKNQHDFVHGVVTFKNSVKKLRSGFEGEVFTFSQKMSLLREQGLDFVIVIDFSTDFSKIEGDFFVRILVELCGLKFLAEGNDFTCGYKGSFGIKEIQELSEKLSFKLCLVDDVMFNDRKISSSRIRESVLNARFSDAQKMLLRPFSYDVSGLEFVKKSESWFETALNGVQVAPKDGSYDVVVIMPDQVLHTSLVKEGNSIKVLLPTENFARQVKAINFIPSV